MLFSINSLILAFIASTVHVSAAPVPGGNSQAPAPSFPVPQISPSFKSGYDPSYAPQATGRQASYAPPPGPPPGQGSPPPYAPPPSPPPGQGPPPGHVPSPSGPVKVTIQGSTGLGQKEKIILQAFEKFRAANQDTFQGVVFCQIDRTPKSSSTPFWKKLLLRTKIKVRQYTCTKQENGETIQGDFTWSKPRPLKRLWAKLKEKFAKAKREMSLIIFSPPNNGGMGSVHYTSSPHGMMYGYQSAQPSGLVDFEAGVVLGVLAEDVVDAIVDDFGGGGDFGGGDFGGGGDWF